MGGLVEELGFEHKSEEWWLFIDSFNVSLKAVLLHNRKKKAFNTCGPYHIYKMLWYVSIQGSAVSGLQEQNRTFFSQNLLCNLLYDTKYCWRHITKPIPSILAVVQKDSFL
jgi:hypothetical protein